MAAQILTMRPRHAKRVQIFCGALAFPLLRKGGVEIARLSRKKSVGRNSRIARACRSPRELKTARPRERSRSQNKRARCPRNSRVSSSAAAPQSGFNGTFLSNDYLAVHLVLRYQQRPNERVGLVLVSNDIFRVHPHINLLYYCSLNSSITTL